MGLIRGIGLIILAGDTGRILTVKELEDKPVIKKTAGMRSFPEETIKNGESVASAMQRLMIEEIGIVLEQEIRYFINEKAVTDKLSNVTMSIGYVKVPMEFEARPVDNDIIFGGWHTIEDMLSGEILTRVETKPILETYRSTIK